MQHSVWVAAAAAATASCIPGAYPWGTGVGWLILIAIVVVGFAIAGSIGSNSDAIKKAKADEQFAVSARDRCEAYVQYLRRTSTNPTITAMTEPELRDFVMSNIRQHKEDVNARDTLAAIIFFGGCGVALLAATAGDGGFVAFILIAGAAVYVAKLAYDKNEKDMVIKYQALDLERERLEVK